MRNRYSVLGVGAFLMLAAVGPLAEAHFPWLTRTADGKAALYFGETIAEKTYHLPESIAKAEIQSVVGQGAAVKLSLETVDSDDFIGLKSREAVADDATLVSRVAYGIYHGALLQYYAVHQGNIPEQPEDSVDERSTALAAQVVRAKDGIAVWVMWNNKPLADAKVRLFCEDGHEEGVATTNASGKAFFEKSLVEDGINAVMVGHEVAEAGEWNGKAYKGASHYLTLTFDGDAATSEAVSKGKAAAGALPPLPFEITSFGAVNHRGAIYVYGGHTGGAHSYSQDEQSNQLLKLDLAAPEKGWEVLAEGPRLQGLGMVAYGSQLILVGGFTAMNEVGEDHDLHSQATVKTYDLATGEWGDLPALPEPRSSHDAALLGDRVYVVGGWQLAGEGEQRWHRTAWSMDLSAEAPVWEALPEPPFTRRALATVSHQGELYVIGGMNEKGGPTRDVVVFNPDSREWKSVGSLQGDSPMAGFGAAGWSVDGQLIVTTYEGQVQRFDQDSQQWKTLGKTDSARFFHRLLPVGDEGLVSIGGANMEEGKFLELEMVNVD